MQRLTSSSPCRFLLLGLVCRDAQLHDTGVADEETEICCTVDFKREVAVGYEPSFDVPGRVPAFVVTGRVVVVQLATFWMLSRSAWVDSAGYSSDSM